METQGKHSQYSKKLKKLTKKARDHFFLNPNSLGCQDHVENIGHDHQAHSSDSDDDIFD
jgi:hypothetical protein